MGIRQCNGSSCPFLPSPSCWPSSPWEFPEKGKGLTCLSETCSKQRSGLVHFSSSWSKPVPLSCYILSLFRCTSHLFLGCTMFFPERGRHRKLLFDFLHVAPPQKNNLQKDRSLLGSKLQYWGFFPLLFLLLFYVAGTSFGQVGCFEYLEKLFWHVCKTNWPAAALTALLKLPVVRLGLNRK